MTWLCIDDGEHMAPWTLKVGNEAYGVYVRLAGYCAQHLTDGDVPLSLAVTIAGDGDDDLAAINLAALGDVGRVEIDTGDRVLRLPHLLGSNQTREQVEKRGADNAKRQQEWRDKQAGKKGGKLHAV